MRISDWSSDVCSSDLEVFGLPEGGLAEARGVLRDFGNMSAVTVLFVMARLRRAGMRGRYLMTALGPGFTAAFQILEACAPWDLCGHKHPVDHARPGGVAATGGAGLRARQTPPPRSEVRRVGKECGSTSRSRVEPSK